MHFCSYLCTSANKGYEPDFWISTLFTHYNKSNLTATTPNRTWGHISATIWSFDVKLLTHTQDPFFKRPNNFCDLWTIGGAISSKNSFLLISFDPLIQISQMRYRCNPWMYTKTTNAMTSLAPSWICRHFELYQKPSKSITGHPDCVISTGLDT